jgi:acetyl/propionyl-CoA carboxylase alpha subunit
MRKLVVANRGEIARRILRSARERGYRVAVVSTEADRDSVVRDEADDVLEVGSFLDGDGIVARARQWGAGFLHPGYGFLSESPRFADLVEKAGIAFVGPTGETMALLGNKERAKELAAANGVPTLPSLGSDEVKDAGVDELHERLKSRGIEPPYLVKAAGGGGGRGMRVVARPKELPQALARASEEAMAGFSDPTVFVESLLSEPRHVEIQVFGDGKGGGVALAERDCSMQRRHQKVIEEAPGPGVDRALREKIGRAALVLVEKTKYRGAGTVEFLLDSRGSFFFLEVNARLQVEHPVTEEILDVDLVAAQLELAEGTWPAALPDPRAGTVLEPKRWAIEARVLAEDPRSQFLPTPGPLLRYREPSGEGLRVDSGVREGSRVHSQFDSMIAKVIGTGATRGEAISRLAAGLASMVVHGTTTNLSFLQAVLHHPDFRAGAFSTSWIAHRLEELNRSLLPEELEARLGTAGFRERLSFLLRGDGALPRGASAKRFLAIGNAQARVGSEHEVSPIDLSFDRTSGALTLRFDGGTTIEACATALDGSGMALTILGETLVLEDPRAHAHRRLHFAATDGEVRAPMAGKVLEVRVRAGDVVEEGEVLAVVESMKMQLEVNAPVSGTIESVLVSPGDVLDGPDRLAVISETAL